MFENTTLRRRDMMATTAFSLGSLAVSAATPRRTWAETVSDSSASPLHHAPRAKRVIFLFMHGGPSHVDTFDYKPLLARDDGKPLPFDLPAAIDAKPTLMNGPWKFAQHGQSGLWGSDLLPEMNRHLDSMCVIRSMHTRGQSH